MAEAGETLREDDLVPSSDLSCSSSRGLPTTTIPLPRIHDSPLSGFRQPRPNKRMAGSGGAQGVTEQAGQDRESWPDGEVAAESASLLDGGVGRGHGRQRERCQSGAQCLERREREGDRERG